MSLLLRFASESDIRLELLRRANDLDRRRESESQAQAGPAGAFGVSSIGYWGGIAERGSVRLALGRKWDGMRDRAMRLRAAAEMLA